MTVTITEFKKLQREMKQLEKRVTKLEAEYSERTRQELVTSRVHRILKDLKLFRAIDMQNLDSSVRLRPSENVLGLYENNKSERKDALLITTHAIHILCEKGEKVVDFREINKVETPPSKEPPLEELTVQLKSGEQIKIPVRGGKENVRDAWEFLRFLIRVQSDAQNLNAKRKNS